MPIEHKGPGGVSNGYGARETTRPSTLNNFGFPRNIYTGFADQGLGTLTVPNAPNMIGAFSYSPKTVSVYFTPPTAMGGFPILDYTVTLSDGTTQVGLNSPIMVTTNTTTAVTATVTARTSWGVSVPSSISNTVIPLPSGLVSGLEFIGPSSGVPGFQSNKFYLNASSARGSVDYFLSSNSGDVLAPSTVTVNPTTKTPSFTLNQSVVGASIISANNTINQENPSPTNYVTKNTDSTIFTESFTNLTAWALGANPPQVSGGRCYGGAGGAGAGMNHSYALTAGDNLRFVVPVTISSSTSNGLLIGVNLDAAGATPTSGGSNVVGMYVDQVNNRMMWVNVNGVQVQIDPTLVRGDYIATVNIDDNWISICLDKTDGAKQYYIRRSRTGLNINNLYLFNGDTAGLSGSYFGPCSARKGFTSIVPRTFGENTAVTSVYTGTAAGDAGYMLWTPTGFDSTVAYPLVVMFHGDGSNETAFVTDPTYPLMRKALLAAGYIVMSCGTTNQSSWGSQTSIDAYFAAWKYAYSKFRITKTGFLGCSMGGIESLNQLAKGKIPEVAVWVGYSPTTNLAKAYATSWTAKINTAYSITGTNTYDIATAGYDPLLSDPTAFRKVPMLFAAATDDSVVPKADNTDALVARVTGVSVEVVSISGITGGHSYTPSSPVLTQIVAFFDKYQK